MDGITKKISVIVPVYKVEKYLEKCVKSLLDQTYSNVEIVLVDDGSPDNCPFLCDKYAEEHQNITAFHKKNGGLSDARNYGVQHVNTEWIAFVDSDDYVEPEYISTLVRLQEEFDADLVITRTSREPENKITHKTNDKFTSECIGKSQALFEAYCGGKIGWAAYGKLYRREALLRFPFPEGFYEDCACMYKIIDDSDKIVIADFENNYHYIERKGSILKSNIDERHLHIFDICEEFDQFINGKYPELSILPVLFYRRGVTQLLNLQSMPWSMFKTVFYKYRSYFRKNMTRVLKDPRVPLKSKTQYCLLCTYPSIYFLQKKIKH